MSEVKSINIEPTPGGYYAIARMFMEDVVGRLDDTDQNDAWKLLGETIKIAMLLAQKHPAEAQKLVDYMETRRTE